MPFPLGAVTLSQAPQLPALPAAIAEVAKLRSFFSDVVTLADEHATADRILAVLPQVTWAHFACHANVDPVAPSKGGLYLHDAILPMTAISRPALDRSELAYLSACSTATHSIRHTDESLTIASAFHLAGLRHVVASLWPLPDRVAAIAARAFYANLQRSNTAEAAVTVRNTALEVRARYPATPICGPSSSTPAPKLRRHRHLRPFWHKDCGG